MKMTKHQQKLYDLGKQAAKKYGKMSYRNALTYLLYDPDFADIVMDLPEDDDKRFFQAGFEGCVPERRQAYRYGEIPKCGYSTNWGTGEREKGVSCVCLIGGNRENDVTIYDTIYGIQGIKKIKIEGWYFGDSGSDGEPLLIKAIKIE